MAYVYAYCLWKTEEDTQSYCVLDKLANQCFPPALATMGDGCIAHHKIKDALTWYSHSIDHGYMMITTRHNKIVLNDAPFLKNMPLRIIAIFDFIPRFVKFMTKGMKGEHALYLDFYSTGHHLNEYWKIPKSQRIKKLQET